jgi:cell wall-associated NlpC family hydrolase
VSDAATIGVPRRAVLVIAAVVIAVLGLAAWAAVAAIGAANRDAGPPGVQMINAQPATYRPAAQAAPAAQNAPLPMGDWTVKRGIQIARRALKWQGWPYSFGAGGPAGPSYGVAVDHDSRNDAHVRGFDCSGLAMYALGPWRQLDHSAAAQYSEVGTFHPALDSLQVGDLIFWSKDGTVSGIGHVAVYIGSGQVVQAPHSGDVIRATPIYAVESGAMGATRPLT